MEESHEEVSDLIKRFDHSMAEYMDMVHLKVYKKWYANRMGKMSERLIKLAAEFCIFQREVLEEWNATMFTPHCFKPPLPPAELYKWLTAPAQAQLEHSKLSRGDPWYPLSCRLTSEKAARAVRVIGTLVLQIREDIAGYNHLSSALCSPWLRTVSRSMRTWPAWMSLRAGPEPCRRTFWKWRHRLTS